MFEITVFLREKMIAQSSFSGEEVRIGRSPDNEVQIDNLGLSRYHASIESLDGIHVIKDFGSQNGTFVNGEPVVGRRALNDGDRIGLGKFSVLFRTQNPTGAPPAPPAFKIGDQASYAVAGETLVGAVAPEARERPCPYAGWIEYRPAVVTGTNLPRIHVLAKDVTVVGSAEGCDVRVDQGPCPERAAAILRGWRGFSLLAMAPGLQRNGRPVDLRSDLGNGDLLAFGQSAWRFLVGRPDVGP